MSEANQETEKQNLESGAETNQETENSDVADFSDANEVETEHAPNVKFVGKRMRLNKQTNEEHLVSIEAPRHVNDADDYIELPSSAEQKKGFYHPKASVLIRLFPDDYKPFVPKGE